MKSRLLLVILTAILALSILFLVDSRSVMENVMTIKDNAPILSGLIFIFIYVLTTVIGLPSAAVLTVLAGMIFGLYNGVLLITIGNSFSLILSFFLGRYLFRDYISTRYSKAIIKINSGLDKYGLLYLLGLRFVPIIPFPALNMSFGITNVSIFQYFWVSQVAMTVATSILVYSGVGIVDIGLVLK